MPKVTEWNQNSEKGLETEVFNIIRWRREQKGMLMENE